jgi:agmatine deiminase
MIIDKETNKVYFSELLKSDKYQDACRSITTILDKHKIDYSFLQGTKDIWARDYMPVQKDKGSFIQFRYEPWYLKGYLHLQSNPKEVCAANGIDPITSDINLDGGNVIKWHDKVIISTRVFEENQGYDKIKLIAEIERLFDARVILIPDIKKGNDMTGHADGYVRFIDGNTILVNEIKDNEFKYWLNGFQKMARENQLNCIEVPWFEYKVKDHPDSAIGLYLNYLEIGNLIILPVFEVENHLNDEVLDLFKSLLPYKNIEPVKINEIAQEGGLMNCISWNIKA